MSFSVPDQAPLKHSVQKVDQAYTVVLVDGLLGGHHQIYERLFAKALLSLGHRVVALVPDPEEFSAWIGAHIPEGMDRCKDVLFEHVSYAFCRSLPGLNHFLSTCMQWLHIWITIKNALRKTGWRTDLVFLCYLDGYVWSVTPAVALIHRWIMPFPWSGLFFHPYVRNDAVPVYAPWLRNMHRFLKRANCRTVAVLDEASAAPLSEATGLTTVVFPDPALEDVEKRSDLRMQALKQRVGDRMVIALVGSLERRKGTYDLLQAAKLADPSKYFFLFAGSWFDGVERTYKNSELSEIKSIMENPPANCAFMYDSFMEDSVLNSFMVVSDVLFAAYLDFRHSSNLLTKAAIFEKPIIVSKGFCMAERVEKYGLGVCVDEGDADAILEAIGRLRDYQKQGWPNGAPNYAGYRALHAIDQLGPAFKRIVCDAMCMD